MVVSDMIRGNDSWIGNGKNALERIEYIRYIP